MDFRKIICWLMMTFLTSVSSNAQVTQSPSVTAHTAKPVLDTTAIKNWASVSNGEISQDGKYVSFNIGCVSNGHLGQSSLVIKDTAGSWRMDIPSVRSPGKFSENAKYAIFQNKDDSLFIVSLSEKSIKCLDTVVRSSLGSDILVYKSKYIKNGVVVLDLDTGVSRKFSNAKKYQIVPGFKGVVIITDTEQDGQVALNYYNFETGEYKYLWSGADPTSLTFSEDGNWFAFSTCDSSSWKMWLQKISESAPIQIKSLNPTIEDTLALDGLESFAGNNRFILFSASEKFYPDKTQPSVENDGIDIWNTKDVKLLSFRKFEKPTNRKYTFSIDLMTGKIIRLELPHQKIEEVKGNTALVGDWISGGDPLELEWNTALKHQYWIKSLLTGESRKIERLNVFGLSLSPEGSYVTYPMDDKLFAYEIHTGKTFDITPKAAGKTEPAFLNRYDTLVTKFIPVAFIERENALLISDDRDIWMASLNDSWPAVNLTEGKGMKDDISFSIEDPAPASGFIMGDKLLLSAFNNRSKDNGYYTVKLAHQPDLQKLIMGPFLLSAQKIGVLARGESMKKSENGIYLVRKMTAEASPNYFVTKDFTNLKDVSGVYPEKSYNWLKTDLIEYRTSQGNLSQGILYRPDDFDSTKRYPVIINFYEKKTQLLHAYLPPDLSHAEINIPWFVSHGYLVFTPDIYYRYQDPGASSLEFIEGARDRLISYRFIDSSAIGIQGWSFGGFEAYYAISHSDKFAAAAATAGIANFISQYLSLMYNGAGRATSFDTKWGQFRMAATLWDITDKYLTNSPILAADSIHTPLLIVHNQQDNTVPFLEGFQMYTGLRRLGRRVWMLDYDGEGHSVTNPENAWDLTVRFTQFFNHYLKKTAAPLWMTRSISEDDDINDLEMDKEIKTPGPGLLKTPEN